jgi:hypothetical protein
VAGGLSCYRGTFYVVPEFTGTIADCSRLIASATSTNALISETWLPDPTSSS